MERGVYFDAWFPRQHCYHPSLPPRRLRMVEDLEEYRATSLVWSALGGGSVSLPYLEQEAYDQIDPRFRFYGFLNDAEFIAECQRRGIKVFGIVFEVQGWEFPVELNEDESDVVAFNELRGAGRQDWMGLREFSQNRYPNLWAPFEHYFPDGLTNSDGEKVTDLLEECVSRDIHGNPCHSTWVECPDREHYCYLMDRNNPVWREYLKAIVRIQIDAGVAGVQLDEADLPMIALRYGGCFCKDCTKLFREHLAGLPAERLPEELAGADLGSFDYGAWLREQGHDFQVNRERTPLYWEYIRFQRATVAKYYAEVADHAREYAASKGREVLVSGNLYYLEPHFYPFAEKSDILITEMDSQGYRQPSWYRYAAGFADGKPVIVVENPYGGVVPELIKELKVGRGYDHFRMTVYEAAAFGINMSIPYGSWMGSVIEDAFYAPHELCVEVQKFLADNERLYSTDSYSETAVVYSIESNLQLNELHGTAQRVPFWSVCDRISDAGEVHEVLMFPEGELRKDSLTDADLERYRHLVLPECRFLTDTQAALLDAFAARGGHLTVIGDFALNVDEGVRAGILERPGVQQLASADDFDLTALPDGPQVVVEGAHDVAVHIHRLGGGAAIHIIRYDYDEASDSVPPLDELTLRVRLPRPFRMSSVHAPVGEPSLDYSYLRSTGAQHQIRLTGVPIYTVVLIQG